MITPGPRHHSALQRIGAEKAIDPPAQFPVSVAQIEQATHLDFLHDLPDDQERQVEPATGTETW